MRRKDDTSNQPLPRHVAVTSIIDFSSEQRIVFEKVVHGNRFGEYRTIARANIGLSSNSPFAGYGVVEMELDDNMVQCTGKPTTR